MTTRVRSIIYCFFNPTFRNNAWKTEQFSENNHAETKADLIGPGKVKENLKIYKCIQLTTKIIIYKPIKKVRKIKTRAMPVV